MSSETTARARVAHHVPGRLRLQLERGADVRDATRRLEENITAMPGVQSVEVRGTSRSVVVQYSPAEIELDRLLDEGLTAATVELIEEGAQTLGRVASRTSVGRRIVNATSTANGELEKATGGIIGLRDALPLTLLGLAFRSVLRGNVQAIPWYNLLYWSYSTFSSLRERKDESVAATPDAREILARRYASGEITRDDYRGMLTELTATTSQEGQVEEARPPRPPADTPRRSRRPRERAAD